MLVPLFPGIPGGPELLVILLLFLLVIVAPLVLLALAVVGGVSLFGRSGSDDRVEELETRVAELERELERERERD
jgi:sec-independent protein translocase protein TatA